MPIFTPGTYWKDCFSHVARFLQQLVNIQSYDLEWKKENSTKTRSNNKLIIQFNAMNIWDCWNKIIQQKSHKLFAWTTNSNCCRTRKQEKKKNPHIQKHYSKNLFTPWAVYVCVCVWLSVEVVSARRGNLLYKRKADVSYVYPWSHGAKEPCIPNHSNPGPRLSWFSDINNFLFHFPHFFPLSFSSSSSPLILISWEQRSALWTDFDFRSVIKQHVGRHDWLKAAVSSPVTT